MVLTKNFKETVKQRVQEDRYFAEALLRESIDCMLQGDVDTGKSILRDYINSTIGFSKVAEATKKSPKSIMRMFSKTGNPSAINLFAIVKLLQEKSGINLHLAP